jgi:hypothetical protein
MALQRAEVSPVEAPLLHRVQVMAVQRSQGSLPRRVQAKRLPVAHRRRRALEPTVLQRVEASPAEVPLLLRGQVRSLWQGERGQGQELARQRREDLPLVVERRRPVQGAASLARGRRFLQFFAAMPRALWR